MADGMFDNWTAGNTGQLLQGIGAVAGAWGSYESDKKRNKLLDKQFAYEQEKDANAQAKLDKAQLSLDSAFDSSLFSGVNKKKKNADGTDIIDTTTAVA